MHDYPDKYHLSPNEALFLAKKKWDENVYCGLKLENRAITFPQTKTILEGVNVPNVKLDDIQAVLNLRDAWRFMLDTMSEPLTLSYICKLNDYIARNEAPAWGVLRTGRVGISGTDYTPPIPNEKEATNSLNAILGDVTTTATNKALSAFCWGCRSQNFWDGNKRTSLLVANKILVQTGAGMLTITDVHMLSFNQALLNFYNTGDSHQLKEMLYSSAIIGIDYN